MPMTFFVTWQSRSLGEVSCCTIKTSTFQSRKQLLRNSANCLENRKLRNFTSTRFAIRSVPMVFRMTMSVLFHLKRQRISSSHWNHATDVAERNHLLLSGTQSNLPSHFEYNDSISFEPVPGDYAILHMHTIPPLSGDTLGASIYEVYDRLGEKYAEFLDQWLTGYWNASMFQVAADKNGFKLYEGERGSPENSKPVL